MATPPPPVEWATDDRRCWTCAGWVEDPHLDKIGDCKLGPNPKHMFRPGIVLRMTHPEQTCARWELSYDADQERARVEGR